MTIPFLVPTLGGILIGLAAGGLFLGAGRMAGISSILAEAFRLDPRVAGWRWAFLGGLLGGGLLLLALAPETLPAGLDASLPLLLAGGALVGLGARLGGGCTSGHGVCGLSHGSGSSLLATVTFMATGAGTVFVAHHLIGGAL